MKLQAGYWRSMIKLLFYCFRRNPGWSAAVLLLMSAIGLLPLGQILLVRGMINSLVGMIAAGGLAPSNQLLWWMLLFAGMVTALNLLFNLVPVVQAGYREANAQVLWEAVLRRLNRTAPLQFEHAEFHNRLARAESALSKAVEPWSESFLWFWQTAVMVIATSHLLLGVHWGILLLALVGGGLHLLAEATAHSRQHQLYTSQTAEHRRESYVGTLLTQKNSLRELLLFGVRDRFHRRWLDLTVELWQKRWRLERRNAALVLIGRSLSALQTAAAFYLLIRLYQAGQTDLGMLAGILTALVTFQQAVGMLVVGVAGWMGQGVHAVDIIRLLESEGEQPQANAAGGATAAHSSPAGLSITLEGLRFRYPGAKREALAGIDLQILPGERVAIVGENGSGKTTLGNLLLGIYPPSEGRIRFDGQDGSALPTGARSAVFQWFVRYWLTVRENIGFGHLPQLGEDQALLAAAQTAGLNMGRMALGTPLGKPFGGTDLSGGEWQRLALARGLLAPSRLLVLDEVTGKMDPQSESSLLLRLGERLGDRTVVFIAHRLPMVRLADRILFLKEGAVAEEGTHEELLARDGFYAQFYRAQAEWYRSESALSARG